MSAWPSSPAGYRKLAGAIVGGLVVVILAIAGVLHGDEAAAIVATCAAAIGVLVAPRNVD